MKALTVLALIFLICQSAIGQTTIVIASVKPFKVGRMTNGEKLPDNRYIYQVVMQDDTTFKTETMVDMSANRYFSITPSQTKSLTRICKDGTSFRVSLRYVLAFSGSHRKDQRICTSV